MQGPAFGWVSVGGTQCLHHSQSDIRLVNPLIQRIRTKKFFKGGFFWVEGFSQFLFLQKRHRRRKGLKAGDGKDLHKGSNPKTFCQVQCSFRFTEKRDEKYSQIFLEVCTSHFLLILQFFFQKSQRARRTWANGTMLTYERCTTQNSNIKLIEDHLDFLFQKTQGLKFGRRRLQFIQF